MVISAPWYRSAVSISLHPVKQLIVINPKVLSAPWYDSIDIIALKSVKKY